MSNNVSAINEERVTALVQAFARASDDVRTTHPGVTIGELLEAMNRLTRPIVKMLASAQRMRIVGPDGEPIIAMPKAPAAPPDPAA